MAELIKENIQKNNWNECKNRELLLLSN